MRPFLRLALLGFTLLPTLAAPAPAQASTPVMRWKAGIDAARMELLREFAPKLIPNCQIRADEQDVAAYRAWRTSPTDEAAIRHEIAVWRLYHCVVTYFDGHRYFVPREHVATDMERLEPVEALGKFFRTAQDVGLLRFTNGNEEKYFFDRYESSAFTTPLDESAAIGWFRTPPWQARH